ncbi:NAD(P)H-dependent oxidoreductase subunit E [Synoicihabitans lomoniglobus]|uniref:NAD(P)H-dependent oxidoreductase subunit E n=1 Tax=Synoicihabitans lomoniglobus TaxID=2909285 RepID=A0AAF0CR72_9BACT|nr:NAD(P)H-dependent oxidoreductase subunit E [Opitutaceae bacterium LMO-M01]
MEHTTKELVNRLSAVGGTESELSQLLDSIEQQHGFIPRDVSDELAKVLALRLERLHRLQRKIESNVQKDVQACIDRWGDEEGNLIMILHEIQNQHGYVPREIAMELSRALHVELARIYEVITFYHYFKLTPPGKHNVTVCMGTACYLKGAPGILTELEKQLGVPEGGTTADRQFHLETVRCIGCCGLSPTMVMDGKTYGKLKPGDVGEIITDAAHELEEAKV